MPGRKRKSTRRYKPRKKQAYGQVINKARTRLRLFAPLSRSTPVGLPTQLRTTLRYQTVDQGINPGVGTVGLYQFRANDCYDPNWTGAGHQPVGFDQFMSFYSRGHVIGSKIVVQINNNSAADAIVGIAIRDQTTGIASKAELMENGACTQKLLSQTTGSRSSATLQMGLDVGKWMGHPNVLNEDSLYFTAASAPGDVVYYSVYAFANDASTDLSVLGFTATIEYDVVFSERIVNSIS